MCSSCSLYICPVAVYKKARIIITCIALRFTSSINCTYIYLQLLCIYLVYLHTTLIVPNLDKEPSSLYNTVYIPCTCK